VDSAVRRGDEGQTSEEEQRQRSFRKLSEHGGEDADACRRWINEIGPARPTAAGQSGRTVSRWGFPVGVFARRCRPMPDRGVGPPRPGSSELPVRRGQDI
jgi:hypothetical protein